MVAPGIVSTVAGLILFLSALLMTIGANRSVPIPFARRPSATPRGAMTMRGIGAGLIVFGAVTLSTVAWYWPLVCAVAGPGTALVMICAHNRSAVMRQEES